MQRFFCDNCGTLVNKNASRCPGCGRFFSLVKCPMCGYSDRPAFFTNGCPVCGYAEEKGEAEFRFTGQTPEDNKKQHRHLPAAFYKIIIPILSVILVGLVIALIMLI